LAEATLFASATLHRQEPREFAMRLSEPDKEGTPLPVPELAGSGTWLGVVGAAAAILLLSVAWTVWS
jgi:hypothetical protein